jgi:prevent-host-death family protein
MKFVSSRELRINPGAVWKLLRQEKDLVITSNGKPVGVLTHAEEGNLEHVLATLRQGRAQAAIAALQRASVARGLDRWSEGRIQTIIDKTRRARRGSRRAPAGTRH